MTDQDIVNTYQGLPLRYKAEKPAEIVSPVSLSRLGIDTDCMLSFLCSLPEGTQVRTENDGRKVYEIPVNPR